MSPSMTKAARGPMPAPINEFKEVRKLINVPLDESLGRALDLAHHARPRNIRRNAASALRSANARSRGVRDPRRGSR